MAENTDKQLLKTVTDKLPYILCKNMLVKPLPEEYIEKEISKPIETGNKDEEGIEVFDTTIAVEKVPTTFRKGIVLAIPTGYEWQDKDNHPEVGDIVIYQQRASAHFDLFKDSQLVNPYNVEAFIKGEN